jgi:hypothetical protein
MSVPTDPTLRELNDCGCCEGLGARTPATIDNRPGLPAIAYRVGTHGTFKQSLLAGLSTEGRPALKGLSTREDDDFSIAFLDAWATVADVLAFYQERIANESYLRTATERRSVLELARAIGYELNPGVAAGSYLAFTLEDAPGAPRTTTIDVGTKVQSVPNPGEHPQTFETVEPLEARVEWNELRPRQTRRVVPARSDEELLLAGVTTGLRPGDGVLVVGDERANDPGSGVWDFRTVRTVEPDRVRDVTRITWEQGLASSPTNPVVYALRLRASLFGSAAPDWRTLADSVRDRYLGTADASKTNFDAEWPNLAIVPGATPAGTGLLGEYFDGIDLRVAKLVRRDAKIDFDWVAANDPAVGTTTFSARWTGTVRPRFSETYTFTTRSDDGVRLWVDGQQLVDNWTDHPAQDDTGTIPLEADRDYDLTLEYYQNQGAASIQLSWSSASQAKEVVPESRLFLRPVVHLGAAYPQVVDGSWTVFSTASAQELFRVERASESSRSGFALSGKTTRLELRGGNLWQFNDHVRDTAVFAQSERLEPAERPVEGPVAGLTIELDRLVPGLKPGKTVVVSGRRMRLRVGPGRPLTLTSLDGTESKRVDPGEELISVRPGPPRGAHFVTWQVIDGAGFEGIVGAAVGQLRPVPSAEKDPVVSEQATLKTVADSGGATTLTLTGRLTGQYDRRSVTIAANVAAATHGETTNEVLGSGDAAAPFQRFELRESPLTYTHADTPSGGRSTLELRVDDVRWDEVPSLFGRSPRERVYVTRRSDDGKTAIELGDGQSGARPPTGRENVRATYRKGLGRPGNLEAGQLSLLLTRPLGVKGVTNPVPATGGQDPQELADARENAPLTVLTLDRVVSLRDYEDFARSFAGVAKAAATWTWHVDRQGVFITVAGVDGAAIAEGDPVQTRLLSSLAKAGDPRVPVDVRSYTPVRFRVGATVIRDDAYTAEHVLGAVEAALESRFSFPVRAFGQPVALSEVVAIVQSVPGVVSVEVRRLSRDGDGTSVLLSAASPAAGDDAANAQPAELLTIDLRRGDVEVQP